MGWIMIILLQTLIQYISRILPQILTLKFAPVVENDNKNNKQTKDVQYL